jgi:hypothetical protein
MSYPPPPPPMAYDQYRKRRRTRIVLIVVGSVVGLLVVLAVIGNAVSSSSPSPNTAQGLCDQGITMNGDVINPQTGDWYHCPGYPNESGDPLHFQTQP